MVALTQEQYIERCRDVHGLEYDYSVSKYTGVKNKITYICQTHGVVEQQAGTHMSGARCPLCFGTPKLTTDQFIGRAIDRFGNRFTYVNTIYDGMHKKVTITCRQHGDFKQKAMDFLNSDGYACRECNAIRIRRYAATRSTSLDRGKTIVKCRKVHGDKYDYSNAVIRGMIDEILIKCKVHNREFSQRLNRHLAGSGCRLCSAKIHGDDMKNGGFDKFKSRVAELFGDKYDLSNVNYNGASDDVKIICTDCNCEFERRPFNLTKGHGCPNCITYSAPSMLIQSILEKNNIIFVREKTFKGLKVIKALRYDFYLPIHNLILEYDGKQHYESYYKWGGEVGLAETQRRDRIKNEWAAANGIPLYRIRYDEDIEARMQEILTEIGAIKPDEENSDEAFFSLTACQPWAIIPSETSEGRF